MNRPAPRNYLAGAERRRLFWRFMPPALLVFLALGWIERAWLRPPPVADVRQVDTRLKDAHLERTVTDAVVIEAEPEPFVAEAEEVGASASSLAEVRDDTVFRPDDEDAWFQIWMTLRSGDAASLRRSDARRVSFIELFGQPKSFRGRLVRFSGTVHRLQRVEAPPNGYDINAYWQAWVEPDDGPASPIVVYFLRLPAGMPTGMQVREPVEVVGYFFKRWAYEAKDTIRTAPLVMALEPDWRPLKQPPPGGTGLGGYALAAMAGLVVATLLAMRLAARGPLPKPEPPPENLSATLADDDIVSPAEALGRMAAEAKVARAPPPVPEEPFP
ncbi:MAG: hypothetical protein EBS56_02560 [Planctomycetia bacterium]|nr:hypothetical protein [Planctomycetia bacterium]